MHKGKGTGKVSQRNHLINVKELIAQYYSLQPQINNPAHNIKFGTSGHRGSSYRYSFNEKHIFAITQAIVKIRQLNGVTGPCLVGKDTHALSAPAFITVIKVLVANGIDVIVQQNNGFTPTPSISHAILTYNDQNKDKADGILITPSHNPPEDGGIKYNFIYGGPANETLTIEIERLANQLITDNQFLSVQKINYHDAIKDHHYHQYNFIEPYVIALNDIVDISAIKKSKLKIGIDPLGGAGIEYWKLISDYYQLNLAVVNQQIDPTFSFVPLDYDGIIRIDCSSCWSMRDLLKLSNHFDLVFANDPDADRHGIITPVGLMNSNHYLTVAIDYLFRHRPKWGRNIAVGKSLVSSAMIDRIVDNLGLKLVEVPVGFKWFVNGLYQGKYGFAGEESAGASFLRFDGKPWTTDKDGIILCLLAAEITARTGKNLQQYYQDLTNIFGEPCCSRIQKKANNQQKEKLNRVTVEMVKANMLAGDPITDLLTTAPGNNVVIGGLKVITKYGWFAVRPSGTEESYKIYCESFRSQSHLRWIEREAIEISNQLIN